MKTQHLYLIAGGVVAAALVWAAKRTSDGSGVITGSASGDTGHYMGSMAIDLVDGVVAGVGMGAAEKWLGIPQTNMTECERAKAEGRTWDASFACPAWNFTKYLFS